MTITKTALDKAITVLAAVAAPVVALLIDTDLISATVGVDLGAIVTAGVGAYHGGAHIQRRATARHAATDPSATLGDDQNRLGIQSHTKGRL